MMSVILEAITNLWPLLLAIAGVAFGWFRHLQAKSVSADAERRVAQMQADIARAEAIQAKANEDAARAGADNAKVRRDEESDVAAMPDSDAVRVLRDEWGK